MRHYEVVILLAKQKLMRWSSLCRDVVEMVMNEVCLLLGGSNVKSLGRCCPAEAPSTTAWNSRKMKNIHFSYLDDFLVKLASVTGS